MSQLTKLLAIDFLVIVLTCAAGLPLFVVIAFGSNLFRFVTHASLSDVARLFDEILHFFTMLGIYMIIAYIAYDALVKFIINKSKTNANNQHT